MRKNQLAAQKAVSRDLTAIALPTRLPLKRIIALLQDLTFQALKTGNTDDIEKVCQKQLLELLDANTEVAVLKGGRRGQLSAEKVIDEPVQEIMPVRLSLEDSGSIQAQGTAAYLKRISGIDPTKTSNAFRQQNAMLINGLSKEICDTIKKTIADLTKQGVHVKGGKQEIANILMNAGLDPAAAPRLAETIFRTQTAAAYNAGRWNIVNDPDTAPYIWGFEYCTAHDRRVRPEHRLLEGVRLPKDDPFWKKYLPPNGWNCRCTVLEIWNDEDIAKVDFGITGIDPRKRTDKELNLLPAFAGNAGVLAAGRGNNGNGSAEASKNPSRATRPNTGQIRAPRTATVQTPNKAIERQADLNNLARKILGHFDLEVLAAKPLIVVCVPFNEMQNITRKSIGWNFVKNRRISAKIQADKNGTFTISTINDCWNVSTLQQAFKDVRDYFADTSNIDKEGIKIEWKGIARHVDENNRPKKKEQLSKEIDKKIKEVAESTNKEKANVNFYIIPIRRKLSFFDEEVEYAIVHKKYGVVGTITYSEKDGYSLVINHHDTGEYVDLNSMIRSARQELAKSHKYRADNITLRFMTFDQYNEIKEEKYIAPVPKRTETQDEDLSDIRKKYPYQDLNEIYADPVKKKEIRAKMNEGEVIVAEYYMNKGKKVERIPDKPGNKRPDFRIDDVFYEVKTPDIDKDDDRFKTYAYRIMNGFRQNADVIILNLTDIPFDKKHLEKIKKTLIEMNGSMIPYPVDVWYQGNNIHRIKPIGNDKYKK